MNLFLDSGAPTIYNMWARKRKMKTVMGSFMKDRVKDDYSFLDSEDYKTYKQAYIDFIVENKDKLDVYINFDIINNAQATWDNQVEMESYGLKPVPVFHIGSDLKWLNMLIDKGYKYIALGGIVPNPAPVIQPILDDVWSTILTDKKGMPKVKVHGFGVTSPRLVVRYPWWSVDSSSWIKTGIYGGIYVPKGTKSKRIYDGSPHTIFTSNKSGARYEVDGKHFETLSISEKNYILDYLKECEIPFGKSTFRKEDPKKYELKENEWWNGEEVETREQIGVVNDQMSRNIVNSLFFLGLEKVVPEWPWPFKRTVEGFGL